MALTAAQLLDELMGRDRNLVPGEKSTQVHWSHPDVCKHFLCGFCANDLFVNTKADLGPCTKIHDEVLKQEYEKSTRYGKMGYEDDFVRYLNTIQSDVERKIRRGHERLQMNKQKEQELAENDSDKTKMLTDHINQLLEEIEQLGGEGKVEEAQGVARLVEQLKEEREQSKAGSGIAGQEKQMEVCEVCGAFLIVGDAQARVDDHLQGKQHVGYAKIKSTIEDHKVGAFERPWLKPKPRIIETVEPEKKEEQEKPRDKDRDQRSRSRRSSGDRHKERRRHSRSRSRDKYRERRRSRDRSERRDRDRSDRDRGRDRRDSRDRDRDRRDRDRDYKRSSRRSRSRSRERSRRDRSRDRDDKRSSRHSSQDRDRRSSRDRRSREKSETRDKESRKDSPKSTQSGSNETSNNSNAHDGEDYSNSLTQDYTSNQDLQNQPTQDYSSLVQQEKDRIPNTDSPDYTSDTVNNKGNSNGGLSLELDNFHNANDKYFKNTFTNDENQESRSEGEVTPSSTKEDYLPYSSADGMVSAPFVDY